VATLKHHAFFAEEIWDWRTVYPKNWLLERVKAALSRRIGPLPEYTVQRLQRLSVEDLMLLHDDPPSLDVELFEEPASEAPRARGRGGGSGPATPRGSGSGGPSPHSAAASSDAWVAFYP